MTKNKLFTLIISFLLLPHGVFASGPGPVIPVLRSGPAGAWNNLKSDPVVIKENGLFKMWYGTHAGDGYQQIAYAESYDGIYWNVRPAPVLRVGKKGEWDAGDIETPAVVKVGPVYHMWYSARAVSDDPSTWKSETAYNIGHATSYDGITWVKDPNNPVLKRGDRPFSDQWNWAGITEQSVVYDEDADLFKMWYLGLDVRGGALKIHVGYATSQDGSSWTEYAENPIRESRIEDGMGYFAPFVMKQGGTYIMLHGKDNQINFQPTGPIWLSTSNDGIHWDQQPSKLLRKGPMGSWNDSAVFGPAALIDGDDLHVWFSGLNLERFTWGIGYQKIPGSYFESNQTPLIHNISIDQEDVDHSKEGIQLFEGTTINLTGAVSDPDNDSIRWSWTYSFDGGAERTLASDVHPRRAVRPVTFSFAPGTAGRHYRFKLKASDKTSMKSAEVSIEIIEAPSDRKERPKNRKRFMNDFDRSKHRHIDIPCSSDVGVFNHAWQKISDLTCSNGIARWNGAGKPYGLYFSIQKGEKPKKIFLRQKK